jgi:hypothetical protein
MLSPNQKQLSYEIHVWTLVWNSQHRIRCSWKETSKLKCVSSSAIFSNVMWGNFENWQQFLKVNSSARTSGSAHNWVSESKTSLSMCAVFQYVQENMVFLTHEPSLCWHLCEVDIVVSPITLYNVEYVMFIVTIYSIKIIIWC